MKFISFADGYVIRLSSFLLFQVFVEVFRIGRGPLKPCVPFFRIYSMGPFRFPSKIFLGRSLGD